MHIIETQAYRKAFNQYLRKGTSIELSLKRIMQESLHHKMLGISTHYIWHTQEDAKVRPSHSANDERIFAWENPPATGHPGEDYGCRCWAEPIGDSGYANQFLITSVNDSADKWSTSDFIAHYLGRSGRSVTLSETGHLEAVIKHYALHATARDGTVGIYKAVENQILEEAKRKRGGNFTYSFNGNYNFQDAVTFSLGESVISGMFEGDARLEGIFLIVSGIITYDFSDTFSDPTSQVEHLMEQERISREDAIARVGNSSDFFGVPYGITDRWQTKFNATVRLP